jgi:hypothetical protein
MKVDFNLKNSDSDKHISNFLLDITGETYQLANADIDYVNQADPENLVINRTTYQLMPLNVSDPFFNWYCYVKRDYQFFADRTKCLQSFLKYYVQWIYKGKPDWKKELVEEEGLVL